jgi:hypothetical protein
VYRDESHRGADYYVTKGGRVAVVSEDEGLYSTDDVGEFLPGPEGEEGLIYQLLTEALGHAVEPTELDI